MDTKQTRLELRFDPDRLRGWPTETHDALAKWIRDLGLEPEWIPEGAPIVVDVAEHTVTTRYAVAAEGTKLVKGKVPETIADGSGLGGVVTVPHTGAYKAKKLPELPAQFHTALADDARDAAAPRGDATTLR